MCGRYYVDDDTAEEIEKVIRLVDAKVNGKLPVMSVRQRLRRYC